MFARYRLIYVVHKNVSFLTRARATKTVTQPPGVPNPSRRAFASQTVRPSRVKTRLLRFAFATRLVPINGRRAGRKIVIRETRASTTTDVCFRRGRSDCCRPRGGSEPCGRSACRIRKKNTFDRYCRARAGRVGT